MALKLMYITNDSQIATDIDEMGVDRVFLDLEIVGKEARQGHLDTVISRHSIEDVAKLHKVIKKGELIVRCNPINSNSEEEINRIISDGADIIMLPFFKSKNEVEQFIKLVDGRVKTMLLFETPEAVENVDEILSCKGIDEVHIGLNDLHLGYGLDFMFELLVNGVVDRLCEKFKEYGLPFGVGGIARLKNGMLPAEYIIAEQYRLGSSCTILSRSFCNRKNFESYQEFIESFKTGLADLKDFETCMEVADEKFFIENKAKVKDKVDCIVEIIKEKKKNR